MRPVLPVRCLVQTTENVMVFEIDVASGEHNQIQEIPHAGAIGLSFSPSGLMPLVLALRSHAQGCLSFSPSGLMPKAEALVGTVCLLL